MSVLKGLIIIIKARLKVEQVFEKVKARLSLGPLVKNVTANVMGGAWNGLLIVLATPWYVSLLGLEGYSLLGFWLLMQMMLSLCDLGLGATVVKEFANASGQTDAEPYCRDLLRTLEYVYWSIAILLSVFMVFSSGWIAGNWFKLNVLSTHQVSSVIKLMALTLGLQFPCALYSNGLSGLQKQGRMNLLMMLGNSLRYGSGVAVLMWKSDLNWFFGVQAIVAAVQTLGMRLSLWRMVGKGGIKPVFRPNLLKQLWRFSLGIALTTISGVLLANVDRLFLSKLASAPEFGKYAIAYTATGLLQMGIQPFYRAYFPRFAELVALGNSARLREEYYRGCRLTAKIIIPAAIIGALFAPIIFTIWIGKSDETIINSFRWLLLGISCAGLMWLPAAFQQAHGWTKLHACMIGGALVIGAPCLSWAIKHWGTPGATMVWVLHGVSDISIGLYLMHRRLLIGEYFHWFRVVVIPPLLSSLPLALISYRLMPMELSRVHSMAWLVMTCGLLVLGMLIVENASGRWFKSATGGLP